MTDHISAQAAGHYEPALHRTFLPRCANCAEKGVITPHPKAFNPTADDICPVCGAPSGSGRSSSEAAVITGGSPSVRLGRALLWLGKTLIKFAKEG